MIFSDRRRAGQAISRQLAAYQKDKNTLVLGLPRGGVVVAEEVAQALRAPMNVILLRKLPYPPQPELAVGAVAEDGSTFINEEFRDAARENPAWLEPIIREQMGIIRSRAKQYRPHRHAPGLMLAIRTVCSPSPSRTSSAKFTPSRRKPSICMAPPRLKAPPLAEVRTSAV